VSYRQRAGAESSCSTSPKTARAPAGDNKIFDGRKRRSQRPNQPLNGTAHVSPFPLMIQLVLVTFTAVAIP
jgi:hypothetical protein